MNELSLHLQKQLSLQDIDVFNDSVLAHPHQPLKGPEHAEDMGLDGLGVPDEEILGVALLLYGAEELLHVPVLRLYPLEFLSADLPALLPVGQVDGCGG